MFWIIFPRFLAKVFHAPLGKLSWHEFENRYFYYWMDLMCNTSIVSYKEWINFNERPRNAISLHTKNYMNKHLNITD